MQHEQQMREQQHVQTGPVWRLRAPATPRTESTIAEKNVKSKCETRCVGCFLCLRVWLVQFVMQFVSHFCEGVRCSPGSLVRRVLPLWAVFNHEP